MSKFMYNAHTIVIFTIIVSIFSTNSVAASKRCAQADDSTLANMKKFGIIQTCAPVAALIEKSVFEIPTEILQELVPFPLDEAVWWTPNSNKITFSIPSSKGYENYTICSYSRRIISEIPKPGEYLKHGWYNLTDKTINYGWNLKRRPLGKGRTSLNVDVYFNIIPSGNLAQAQQAGLCMKDLKPASW